MADERAPLTVVTGAAGTIGTVLGHALAGGYTVVGLDEAGKTADMPLIPVDLTADASVEHALERLRDTYGARIASVIHLAGYDDFSGERNPLYQELTVDGTRRLLDGLQRFRVEQFVFMSTMLVEQATGPDEKVDEERPLQPRWAYPESKAKAEAVVRERHGAIPWVILRLAGLYDERTVVPTLAHQIARIRERDLESHFYAGNLDTAQSMIHHADVASAVRAVVDRRAGMPADSVLLLGEPDPPGYRQLQDAIGEALHGEEWTTLRVPAAVAAAGAWVQDTLLKHLPERLGGTDDPFLRPFMMAAAGDNYALDIDRARTLLGWEPRHRLLGVLPAIIAGLKDDPKGWYARNGIHRDP